ncbi:MAG: methylaspartate mutase [Streptosporangiaceae bacterium]|jgi:methylaspartate mutase epsilon subunit
MTAPAASAVPSFGRFVADSAAAGQLVVQPRMGFSDLRRMRRGLLATKFAAARTVGTLTLDSYTRLGDHAAVRRALADGTQLNGYPIVDHPVAATQAVLDGVLDESFPVQVRHGSSRPGQIIRALTAAGLDASEGGPISYCLPYGRTPLRESMDNWARGCELLTRLVTAPRIPHLESFGGCLLGQLCPPGLLVAISLLEALFFTQHGMDSVSLSYAQQTDTGQDEQAVVALGRLAAEFLPRHVDWHVVLYTYMGVFPRTERGARRLLEASAELAVRSGAQRLIVKTAAEAHCIPTVEENVHALETAARAAAGAAALQVGPLAGTPGGGDPGDDSAPGAEVQREARAFIEAVLELGHDVGRSLLIAFRRGYLDIPYCLHPDNAGRSRGRLDERGRLCWSAVGAMPVRATAMPRAQRAMTSAQLLRDLYSVAQRFDH